ncbi:hypothetical protein DXG03_004743 [Asterophora parasitica]|uniref:Uncharacterized protein n=1 Tax=Asterophora parasitica TaxID=117018 RepID=A0A9P7G9W9_9AGAR|nr:hypothetical protein DXG03_004743 [Asterophora parasitica]
MSDAQQPERALVAQLRESVPATEEAVAIEALERAGWDVQLGTESLRTSTTTKLWQFVYSLIAAPMRFFVFRPLHALLKMIFGRAQETVRGDPLQFDPLDLTTCPIESPLSKKERAAITAPGNNFQEIIRHYRDHSWPTNMIGPCVLEGTSRPTSNGKMFASQTHGGLRSTMGLLAFMEILAPFTKVLHWRSQTLL